MGFRIQGEFVEDMLSFSGMMRQESYSRARFRLVCFQDQRGTGMATTRWAWVVGIALCSPMIGAQEFRSSVGVSWTTLRFEPGAAYVGYGVDYRFMVRDWVGVEAEAGVDPAWQTQTSSDLDGRSLGQASGAVLVGHRWGRFGVYGVGGFGVLSESTLYYPPGWKTFNFADLVMGGLLDVAVARRWSLTYEVRDNLAFTGSNGFNSNVKQMNLADNRVGMEYHFERVKGMGRRARVRSTKDREALKGSFGVSYSAMRETPFTNYASFQYLGAGAELRYMAKSWVGVEVQGSYAPQFIDVETPFFGGQVVQADAEVLVGHRWGRVGLYGTVGGGVHRTRVFGALSDEGSPVFEWRDMRDMPVGGMGEVWLGRRWSVTFGVRDEVTFVGPFSFGYPGHRGFNLIPPPSRAFVMNSMETRSGVAVHF
jgi:hypothetical protein